MGGSHLPARNAPGRRGTWYSPFPSEMLGVKEPPDAGAIPAPATKYNQKGVRHGHLFDCEEKITATILEHMEFFKDFPVIIDGPTRFAFC